MQLIQIPDTCPCCDYKLELVRDQLFCRNPQCSAQVGKKLEHFVKALSIKGLGPKTLEKLQLADITELFYLEFSEVAELLGSEKVAEKILAEIEAAKTADLSTVLTSFGITLIGETASAKICSVVDSIDDITYETCQQAGLGDKASTYLMEFLEGEFLEVREGLPFSFKVNKRVAKITSGETVCVTGKLSSYKTKADAYAALQAAGFTPVESVTKTTKYLIDETEKTSAKRKKAEEYGIAVITNLNEFLKKD